MTEAPALAENSTGEITIRFDDDKFVTPPYSLRRWLIGGLHWGDALHLDHHWLDWSLGRYLSVPPNVAAVVLLSNGKRVPLPAGRYLLSKVLNGSPVSVQFVTMQVRSYVFDGIHAKTRHGLDMKLEARLALQVVDPVRITELADPLADVRSAFQQELIEIFVNNPYDKMFELPSLLNAQIKARLDRVFAPHGLSVPEVWLIQFGPDTEQLDLARRGELVDLKSEVRRRETQMEEDVFAIEQTRVARMAITSINRELREQNYQARLASIQALRSLAEELVLDLRNHPGRFSVEDEKALRDVVQLLDKLGSPQPALPIGPVRSWYSQANYPPPSVPPVTGPEVPPATHVDPEYAPDTLPRKQPDKK